MATMYSITINVDEDQLNGLTSSQLLDEVANFLEEILNISAVVTMDELEIQEENANWDYGTGEDELPDEEIHGWWEDAESGDSIN